jgi:hypothetical protein
MYYEQSAMGLKSVKCAVFLIGKSVMDKMQVARSNICDVCMYNYTYLYTYHSRFIPEGVAEVSQIFLRDTHVLPKLVSYEEHCRRDRW